VPPFVVPPASTSPAPTDPPQTTTTTNEATSSAPDTQPVATTAALKSTRTVSGVVYIDLNSNSNRSPNEVTVGGASIMVVMADGTRVTVITDRDGRYSVDNVPLGPVTLEVLANGLTRTSTVEVLGSTEELDVPLAAQPTSLALTGNSTRGQTLLAVSLLAVGCVLLAAGRRRLLRR
jgi:hypothetical protein